MKTVTLHRGNTGDEVQFLVSQLASAPGEDAPMTISGVRAAIRILDKLEALPEGDEVDLELEDNDFAHLKLRLDQIRWLRVNRPALALIDRIKATS